MPPASARSVAPTQPAPAAHARKTGRPFFGLIESVIVEPPVNYEFDGAISREHAGAVWTWMVRDLAADLIDLETPDSEEARAALDALMPELLSRTRAAVAAAADNYEATRKLKTQMGGEAAWSRLPTILNALKVRSLLERAQAFGRAANGMQDDTGLAVALQNMPFNDSGLAALLMMAAVGQVTNPSRLMTAVVRITGSEQEVAIQRAGYSPLVDALLAHAQNQVRHIGSGGAYADVDLACRALDRYHRLARAVSGFMELARNSRWSGIVAALTKQVSGLVEPRLRDVAGAINMAMRRGREGSDRLDGEQVLVALSGVYVLATVRDCRDSLAVNATFDQAWAQVGQGLEIHIQRAMEILRANPADTVTAARLDAAIKMAELRFNPEYAETLRRAKEIAEKPRA